MSWVNLDDVYVNKSGDSIAGNLSVGGALTINDAKGTGGMYNVANEITTLRDSVSPTVLYIKTSAPLKAPHEVIIERNVNDFDRLVVFGSTFESKRCSVELIKSHSQIQFNDMYFTLLAYNGQGDTSYLKMTDYKINISGSTTQISPIAFNEIYMQGTSAYASRPGIGVGISAVYAYTDII